MYRILLILVVLLLSQPYQAIGASEKLIQITGEKFPAFDLRDHSTISLDQTQEIATASSNETVYDDVVPNIPKTMTVDRYWLKVMINNTSEKPIAAYLVYAYTFIFKIDMYTKDDTSTFTKLSAGTAHPRSEWAHSFRRPAFRVDLKPGLNSIYLSVYYPGVKPPYFTLLSESGFNSHVSADTAVLSCCLGFILFALIYNCFVYLQLRYAYIARYILVILAFFPAHGVFTGFIGIMFPDGDHSLVTTFCNIAVGMVTYPIISYFAIEFLNLKGRFKKIDLMQRCAVLTCAAMIISLAIICFGYKNVQLASLLAVPVPLVAISLLLYLGFSVLKSGYKPALYYLVSWAPCLGGVFLLIIVMNAGVGTTDFADLWPSIGSCIQVSLLSLALGNRVKIDTDRLNKELEVANSSLRLHVEQLDELVDEKTARIKYILDNVNIAIFKFGPDQTIDSEHSLVSPAIFDRQHIAGLSIGELLFPDEKGRSTCEKHDIMNAALTAAVSELELAWMANAHALPKEIVLSGSSKTLELDWTPIVEDDVVKGGLVIARDVTYTRKLEEENQKAMDEVNLIKRISQNGRDRVVDYVESELDTIKKTRKVALSMSERKSGVYDINFAMCLRNLHTIKGNARTYGFDEVSGLIHKCESDLRESTDLKSNLAVINSTLKTLDLFFENALDVINRYIPTARDSTKVNARFANESLEILDMVHGIVPPIFRDKIASVSNYIKHGIAAGLDEIVEPIRQHLPSISARLGKSPPVIDLNGYPVFLRKEHAHKLRSLLIHLVRNSVDHGIEAPGERENRGKSPEGRINLTTTDDVDDFHTLVYEDDGRGLAIKRIHQRAVERGFITASDSPTISELADLIFLPGFTSKTELEATDISGRGVGMDAVKDVLNEFKGNIAIEFFDNSVAQMPFDQFRGLYVQFRFVIRLPKRICA